MKTEEKVILSNSKELSEAIGEVFIQTTQLGIVLEFLSQELRSQLGLKIDQEAFQAFATEAWARMKDLS